MFNAVKLLEEAGVSKFEINYRTKVISGLSKEDLFKLMNFSDDGSMVPVAFAREVGCSRLSAWNSFLSKDVNKNGRVHVRPRIVALFR